MTLLELSAEYRAHAAVLKGRLEELEEQLAQCRSKEDRLALEKRIRLLSSMLRDTRELAVLTEHYYDRGFHHSVRYQI